MSQQSAEFERQWSALLRRLRAEVATLGREERDWITARLAAISLLQEELHACAAASGSEGLCAACSDCCCDRGAHHVTLANLLFYLLDGHEPPSADFSRSCPQLGAHGCQYPPDRRPFNCVTFNCEAVEQRMPEEAQRRYRALEPALRALYESFERRYAGAGLRGILIRAERLGARPLLGRLPA